jgi:omega-amidase
MHDHTESTYRSFMRAHLVQLDIAWHDKNANYRAVESLLDRADVTPGDLVVLPEMFDTGFSWDIATTADKDGSTLRFLAELADDLGACVIGGRTVHDCHCAKARNVVTALAPGDRLLAEFAKMHLFPLGNEAQAIEPGPASSGIITFHWGDTDPPLTLCPAICYDLRFPELFRRGLSMGAEMFVVPACWLDTRHAHWRTLLLARAIENQAFVLGVNRTGRDPNANYLGGSIAIDPTGTILGELAAEQAVLSIDIDPAAVRRSREKFPAWRDRRL